MVCINNACTNIIACNFISIYHTVNISDRSCCICALPYTMRIQTLYLYAYRLYSHMYIDFANYELMNNAQYLSRPSSAHQVAHPGQLLIQNLPHNLSAVTPIYRCRQLQVVDSCYILKNDILSYASIWLSLKKKALNGFWRILNPDTPLILLSGQHFKDNMTETDIHHAISVGFIIDNRMIVDCKHKTWVRGIQTPGRAVHHSPFCIIYTMGGQTFPTKGHGFYE